MRTAGRLLAEVMEKASDLIKIGSSTFEIDAYIETEMRKSGLRPECKGYAGYPAATCISLNDTVVHGMPSRDIVLKDGDVVKVDVVGSYKGYCADMARTFFVGNVPEVARQLTKTAQEALDAACKLVAPGVKLSSVSTLIQKIVERNGFAVVREFAGHGIGRNIHEAPEIPNFSTPCEGVLLQKGMALAIEPMLLEHKASVVIADDGWTARSADGCLTAHVEDTIIVCDDGVEILTRLSAKPGEV